MLGNSLRCCGSRWTTTTKASAGVLRKQRKKALQRRHAARRSADGDDGRLALLARRCTSLVLSLALSATTTLPFSGRSQHIQETSRGASKFRRRRAALTRLIGPYPGAGMARLPCCAGAPEPDYAARATTWRATRNTTKCDSEKLTMKLARIAKAFARYTGKSSTCAANTSVAVLAMRPTMPAARNAR